MGERAQEMTASRYLGTFQISEGMTAIGELELRGAETCLALHSNERLGCE